MAADNPYLSLVDDEERERRQAALINVNQADGVDPERQTRLERVRGATGLPIQDDGPDGTFEQLEKQQRQHQYGKLIDESPGLQRWLAQHGDAARLAADDLEELSAVEKALNLS